MQKRSRTPHPSQRYGVEDEAKFASAQTSLSSNLDIQSQREEEELVSIPLAFVEKWCLDLENAVDDIVESPCSGDSEQRGEGCRLKSVVESVLDEMAEFLGDEDEDVTFEGDVRELEGNCDDWE